MQIPFQKLTLQPRKKGDAEIRKLFIEPTNLRAILHDFIPVGEYRQLLINKQIVMTDTPMEQNTNLYFYDKACGDVLIGGLGLGMILPAIAAKKNVKSITVLEVNQNVIDLVWPQLQGLPNMSKVTLVQGDVFSPHDLFTGRKFDAIYMDIWAVINAKAFSEMEQLRFMYKKYLKHPRFNEVFCWCYLNAKYGVKPTASL